MPVGYLVPVGDSFLCGEGAVLISPKNERLHHGMMNSDCCKKKKGRLPRIILCPLPVPYPSALFSLFTVNICAAPRSLDPGGCYRTRIHLSPTQRSSNKDASGEAVTLLSPPVSLAPPTLLVWAIIRCSLCWGLALCYPSPRTKPALLCPVILRKENEIWSCFRCRYSVY